MNIDQVVLLVIACCTVGATILLRQRGSRGRRLAAAVTLSFFGIVVLSMMIAHSIEITYHLMVGDARFSGEPWAYDFQFYSLHLFAVVTGWQGARALGAARLLGEGASPGLWRLLSPLVATLMLAAPLIPFQPPFGVMYTVLSTVTIAAVAFLTRRLA